MSAAFKTRPRCPMCEHRFETPAISGGYVRCPPCDTPMFQYRRDGDEGMTPKQFTSLLHPRANEAVLECMAWFDNSILSARLKALFFVVRLWPTLAMIFQQDEEPVDA